MAIAEINGALASIKVAMDLGRGLAKATSAIEVATLKLQVSDLMSALSDTKIAVGDAQAVLDAKNNEIAALRSALEIRTNVVRHLNAYYESNSTDNPSGDPYCMRCWEGDHRLLHIALGANWQEKSVCPHCKSEYSGPNTPRLGRG